MARNCESEMSVWTDSGGFACTKAVYSQHALALHNGTRCSGRPTFCPQVLCPLQLVHGLERLCLLLGKLLLVVIFTRARYAVEEDAARMRIPEVVNNGGEEEADAGGAQDGEDADHDALCRGSKAAAVCC